jgi:hydrogenase expression/formation protein HypE
VVTPPEFPGGDIGKLAVCGTINDVLMMGAVPKYLTCGFILEAGLEIALLERVVRSMADAAAEAGVIIVAGDTKVIEHRGGAGQQGGSEQASGLFINTTGIGVPRTSIASTTSTTPTATTASTPPTPSALNAKPGDAIIVSGTLGDHHACILSARMGITNGIKSDCAILAEIPDALYHTGIEVRTMRDVTRGGLGTVINEIGASSGVQIELEEGSIPVNPEVKAFCGIMGLDPIYMGNEGKLIVIVAEKDREQALAIIRATAVGKDARIIGHINAWNTGEPHAILRTKIGGTRRIDMLFGEGLQRIC